MKFYQTLLTGAVATALIPGTALAAPGNSVQFTGSVNVNVIEPGSIVPVEGLRFGRFLRPATAGTLTINHSGTIATTGGMTASIVIPQFAPGRGPASFALSGNRNRQVNVNLPTSITISNGSQTMTVNTFNANVNGGGKIKLDINGQAVLRIGGRLNVAANQAYGSYVGTFNVTVAYQ